MVQYHKYILWHYIDIQRQRINKLYEKHSVNHASSLSITARNVKDGLAVPAWIPSGSGSASRQRAAPSPVLCAGGGQRGRSRFPQRSAPAHGGKTVDMRLTLSWPWHARIVPLPLVDRFSSKVREPSLDSPRGHEHQNPLTCVSARNVAFSARGIEFVDTPFDAPVVAVHHYKERDGDAVLPAPVFLKLFGKTIADELFACSTSFRCPFDPDVAYRPAGLLKETSTEGLMLPVLAQEHDLYVPAHLAHPLAISSESLRPPSSLSTSGLRAVMTPDFSRWRRRPLSPPR